MLRAPFWVPLYFIGDRFLDIKIVIAMHKPFQVADGTDYVPLQVGADGKKGIRVKDCPGAHLHKEHQETGAILRDDDGDNISAKNPYYCELTGLYFAWKNIKADAIGLVHYRRYFSMKNFSDLQLYFQKFNPISFGGWIYF